MQQFDSFVQHNDSVFIQFLTQSWKEFYGTENKVPTPPKPVQQPKAISPDQPKIPEKTDTTKLSPEINIQQAIPEKKDSVPPKVEALGTTVASSSFLFYGAEIPIPLPGEELPVLSMVTKQGIISFFTSAANSSLINDLIIKVKKGSTNCKLNDWGLASMLITASQKLYTTRP
jgi:hypothetical protein